MWNWMEILLGWCWPPLLWKIDPSQDRVIGSEGYGY